MLAGNQNIGGYAEARDPAATVAFVTTNAAGNGFAARYPYDVIGCFGKGWDDFQTMTDEFVTVAQNLSDTDRQLIVSNEEDFFVDFESTYEIDALPTVSLSYGKRMGIVWAPHSPKSRPASNAR